MAQYVFIVIAALGLIFALGTVLARNLVHAALFLIAFFFTVACQFVLLEAEFLAAIQVLVYIGAVAILMMFGIMLTRNIQGDDTTIVPNAWKVPALFAGICLFTVLAFGINNAVAPGGVGPWTAIDRRPSIARDLRDTPESASLRESVNNMAKVVGQELMTRYVVAFEVAGLLLTAALVGAIVLAHREEDEPGTPRPTETRTRSSGRPPEIVEVSGQPVGATSTRS